MMTLVQKTENNCKIIFLAIGDQNDVGFQTSHRHVWLTNKFHFISFGSKSSK